MKLCIYVLKRFQFDMGSLNVGFQVVILDPMITVLSTNAKVLISANGSKVLLRDSHKIYFTVCGPI
jgi:hypothetical protein